MRERDLKVKEEQQSRKDEKLLGTIHSFTITNLKFKIKRRTKKTLLYVLSVSFRERERSTDRPTLAPTPQTLNRTHTCARTLTFSVDSLRWSYKTITIDQSCYYSVCGWWSFTTILSYACEFVMESFVSRPFFSLSPFTYTDFFTSFFFVPAAQKLNTNQSIKLILLRINRHLRSGELALFASTHLYLCCWMLEYICIYVCVWVCSLAASHLFCCESVNHWRYCLSRLTQVHTFWDRITFVRNSLKSLRDESQH